MRMPALALAVVVSASGGRAAGDVRLGAHPELRLGAGYDDNLVVDVRPQGPRDTRSDAIFDVAPRLAGWLGVGGHTLTLSLDYLERITVSTGELRDLVLRLGYRTPLYRALVISAGGFYERFMATELATNDFDLGGGEIEIAAFIGARVRLSAGWRGAARRYLQSTAEIDNDQRASLRLRATPLDWLTLAADYTFIAVRSDDRTAELDRHGGEVGVAARPTAWLVLAARYGIASQQLPFGAPQGSRLNPRTDLRQSFGATVSARPLRWLEIYARYELLDSRSTDKSGVFRGNLFVGGVTLWWDAERRIARPPALAPTLRGDTVVFRHRARPGQRVSVVGDWNAWEAAASPLAEVAPGRYEAAYMVPKGRHEYAFSVDGAIEPPADAPAFAPDGFGGRNGVITIP